MTIQLCENIQPINRSNAECWNLDAFSHMESLLISGINLLNSCNVSQMCEYHTEIFYIENVLHYLYLPTEREVLWWANNRETGEIFTKADSRQRDRIDGC